MAELETITSDLSVESDLEDYRPLSPLAMAAAALGVCSAGVLISRLFWPLAIVGVVISLLALVRVSRENGRVLGRSAALIGLGLSILFLTYAPAKDYARKVILAGASRPIADQWIDAILQGRIEAAHQLTRKPHERVTMEYDELRAFYESNKELNAAAELYAEDPAVKSLLGQESDAEFEFIGTPSVESAERYDRLVHKYQVDMASRPPFVIYVQLRRTPLLGDKMGAWNIEQVGRVNN